MLFIQAMIKFPYNIAIIMDGNRRWAEKTGVSIFTGHKKGAQNLKNIVKSCSNIDVKELTVFAFSTENWNRLPLEVNGLLKLIKMFLKSEIAELDANDVVFKIIGNRNQFSKAHLELFESSENLTRRNKGMIFNVCLNYGGEQDITSAVRSIAMEVENNKLSVKDINETIVRNNLLSNEVSDIDLLIRTSGESRISNFLLWQLAYAELYFTDILWPEFTEKDLIASMNEFLSRERRFGATILDSDTKTAKTI